MINLIVRVTKSHSKSKEDFYQVMIDHNATILFFNFGNSLKVRGHKTVIAIS